MKRGTNQFNSVCYMAPHESLNMDSAANHREQTSRTDEPHRGRSSVVLLER